MIEVLFSREFDSGVWTGPKPSEWGVVGQVALGELGLLDLLETQLGLKQPESISYQRKIDYLQALRTIGAGPRFYSESLKTDPMAVTEHLLELRDALIESGWKKNQIKKMVKINDLAEVEKVFSNKTGKADRLALVCDELAKREAFEIISTINVFNAEESLSYLWKVILKELLPKFGVKVSFSKTDIQAQADSKTDLGKLLALRQSESEPKADGSFTLLTGRDPWESARYVAAFLKTLPQESLERTVILAPEKQRGILMSAMISQGIPYGGNHAEVSYARPALQILILALALTWEPKDPSIALSLITTEGSPVPRAFRRGLISSFDESLAVGGSTWSKYLDEVTNELIEKAETPEEKEKIKDRKQRITEWFAAPSYSFESGIPTQSFVDVCARVSKWLRQMWVLNKKSSFRGAYDLAELLSSLAKGLGEATITRERMIHLLIDSVGDGIIADGTIAQANGVRIVSHPSSVIAQAENFIWWDFSSSTVSSHHETFFSQAEVKELLANHIEWPRPEVRSIIDARSWSLPLLNTKSKVLLVSQLLDVDGNADSFHPALDELIPKKVRQKWKALVHVNLLEKESKPTKEFLKDIGATFNNNIEDNFIPRASFQAPKDEIALREVESASSLSKLLGCDLAYVLTYKARLSGMDSASLEYNERVMGIIAHEVISTIFKEGASLTPAEALSSANKIIDDIIRDKAPQVLQKENVRRLSDLKETVFRDIEFYATFLQDNKLSVIGAEKDIPKSDKTLGPVHVMGQIDHILADENGKQIIMDHKFGGAKYKEQDLVSGKSLQLALYSKLVSGKAHPDLAYHIISSNKILVLNKSFNRAQQVNGPDSAEVLLEAEKKVSEKAKILKAGKLLAHGHIEENETERFPAPCGYCEFNGICGLAWKQEALA
jgi:ATP-dependent helicase/nuclease subunit B